MALFISEMASATYCVYNGNTVKGCYDNLKICKEFENKNFAHNDECRKQEDTHNYPKSVDPKAAKKGACLWMETNKKWANLGCMETRELCNYAEKKYKSQAKVECR